MSTSRTKSFLALVVWIGICWLVQGLAAWITSTSVNTWYPTLEKPSFNPPGWVFGPVWATLYTLMGISAWLVWRERTTHNIRPAMVAFAVQLALNGLWSFLFFGMQSPGLASIEIVLLWAAILVTLVLFFPLHRTASLLLVPYIVWVSYAAILTFSIWRLNS